MNEREKIVNAFLHCRVNELCSTNCPYWDRNPSIKGCTHKLATDVYSLLEEQEARVMTLDEIRKADYVWLEVNWPYTKDHEPYLNIALPVPYEDWNHEDMILFRVKADIDQADHDCSVHYFGTVWRCWTAKPTPEQMSGTEWETKI